MTRGRVAPLALASLVFGCSGEQTQIGTAEPFRIHAPSGVTWAAQFVKGKLPGSPPTTGPDAGPGSEAQITQIGTPRAVIQGQANLAISGIVTLNAASVGIALGGVGTGYWVVPVGGPDPSGGLEWHALADFDRSLPNRFYNFHLVAFDEAGKAGPQLNEKSVCVTTAVPDNFHTCNGKPPPDAVISLAWDANVDLDLQVRTPTGRFVEPKNPTTLPLNEAGVAPQESGFIDRDSNAACVIDGARREDLVWPTGDKPDGLYTIYANLFDSCKQPSVRFTVTAYYSEPGPDGGNFHLVKGFERSGELLDFQANGGSGRGLFVGEVIFH